MRVVQLQAAWTDLSVPAARGPLTTARLPAVNPREALRRYTSPILSSAPPAEATLQFPLQNCRLRGGKDSDDISDAAPL